MHTHVERFRRTGALLALGALAIGACNDITTAPKRGVTALVVPDTGTADGASVVALRAAVDTMLPRDQWRVTFGTTVGKINDQSAEVTVVADTAGVARALLRAPSDSASGIVTASAGGVALTAPITFRRARAQSLAVELSTFVLDTGYANSVTVTVTLRRAVGIPSPGDTVHLDAQDSAGQPIGRFSSSSPSDAHGQATARYTIGDRAYAGAIRVVATARGAGTGPDSVVSGSALLQARMRAAP